MIWVVFGLMGIVVILEVSTLFMFGLNFKSFDYGTNMDDLPFISVLVAARNEEANLEKCLTGLSRLNYPPEKLEVLIGDDASTDITPNIINDFAQRYPHFNSVEIKDEYKALVAKSKVLAQLINASKGAYVAFIDADMVVTPDWLLQLTAPLKSGYSIVSGYSEVIAASPFQKYQYYDWLNALHFLKSLSDNLKPATTLGNNMIVSLKDYRNVGGFEEVGPNLVEDLALLKVMQQKGFKAIQIVIGDGRAQTLAVSSVKFWISQRKRWIKGALNGPLYERAFLILQRLLIPLALIATILFPMAISFVFAKILIESVKSIQMHAKTTQKRVDIFMLLSPVVNSVLDTFALIGLLFKSSVSWKERKY